MQTHIDIPQEIWLKVGQFVPDKDLRSLLDVNYVFFNLAMDVRYRNIIFHIDERTMKMLQRLKSPGVSKRVRHLTIDLDYGEFTTPTSFPGLASGISFQHAMIEAVSGLHNVVDFCIEWGDMPTLEDLMPLFTAAWNTFGSTLEKLTLLLNRIPPVFSTIFASEHLRELHIGLATWWEDKLTFTNTLARLINNHASTLLLLSITSGESPYDDRPPIFGQLFSSLDYIPNLRQLDIYIDSDLCGLSNHCGLTSVLEKHSHILKSFRFHPPAVTYSPLQPLEVAFGEWMQINTSNAAIFRGLESLELGIPISSATLFELMLLYLQRSAETLTTLTLLTSNLQYKEVQSIIQIFSHRGLLETVHLQVLCLNTQLVDLLASALPNLRVLNLDITEVSGHGETSNMNTMYTHEEQSKQMTIFGQEMEGRTYPNWKLYDIGIVRAGWQDLLVSRTLAASVPSIRSFWGQGDMTPPGRFGTRKRSGTG